METSNDRRIQFLLTVVVGVLSIGGVCLWELARRPVPSSFVGRWVSAEALMDTKPGEVTLIITRDGHATIDFDRRRYFWAGATEFELVSRYDTQTIRSLPHGEPVDCEYEVTETEFRITLEGSTHPLVFRRPGG